MCVAHYLAKAQHTQCNFVVFNSNLLHGIEMASVPCNLLHATGNHNKRTYMEQQCSFSVYVGLKVVAEEGKPDPTNYARKAQTNKHKMNRTLMPNLENWDGGLAVSQLSPHTQQSYSHRSTRPQDTTQADMQSLKHIEIEIQSTNTFNSQHSVCTTCKTHTTSQQARKGHKGLLLYSDNVLHNYCYSQTMYCIYISPHIHNHRYIGNITSWWL